MAKNGRKIIISDQIKERIDAFRQIVEAVLEEKIDDKTYHELVFSRGLERMLLDIIGSVEHETLLKSFSQLAEESPEVVYKFIAETLKRGTSIRREELQQKFGFDTEN